jgi:hypothetical protein
MVDSGGLPVSIAFRAKVVVAAIKHSDLVASFAFISL